MNGPRKFDVKPAVRERVPLLIGLVGPSSSGKTKSALRLADGMRKVFGGEHYLIDTESRRALHYAGEHQFKHIDFTAPYGSLDYLAAIRQCVDAGASVVTIDSMSHEHENVGGMLDFQEHELQRMAGDDPRKREACKFAAWIAPKRARTQLLQGLLTLNCNFIFCFRAREKTRPIKNAQGKTEFQPMGYQAIAGEDFLFEQTVNCLLLPSARGVPTWHSQELGERALIKLPAYLADCFESDKPLDEATGERLALWARGASAASSPSSPPRDEAVVSNEVESDLLAQIEENLKGAATLGTAALEEEWKSLHKKHRQAFKDLLPVLKKTAAEADKAVA